MRASFYSRADRRLSVGRERPASLPRHRGRALTRYRLLPSGIAAVKKLYSGRRTWPYTVFFKIQLPWAVRALLRQFFFDNWFTLRWSPIVLDKDSPTTAEFVNEICC